MSERKTPTVKSGFKRTIKERLQALRLAVPKASLSRRAPGVIPGVVKAK